MMTWDGTLRAEVASVRRHTEQYVGRTLGLALQGCQLDAARTDELELRSLSTLIALGGATSVLVCFTVDEPLAEALFAIETEGLDIADLDRDELVRSTLSELANIVLGHCTADLCAQDQSVSLTAPIVLDAKRLMAPPPKASFARLCFQTAHGMLEVLLFGPRESLDVESMCGQAL